VSSSLQQPLNEAQCVSSCPNHACYSPDYNGPWPSTMFDQTFVIDIP